MHQHHKNNRPFMRRALAIVMMVLMAAPGGAQTPADIMFQHTQATSGQASNQNWMTGGGYEVRIPQKTYQLFSGEPPSFSAGCAGISLHLGSFSFISIDAFKDMLRKIAQAAPGYFLHLAIQTMCTPCSNLLTWLQNLMADLNSAQMNSCQIGKKVASTLFTSIFDEKTASREMQATSAYQRAVTDSYTGDASDWAQALGDQVSGLANKLFGKTPAEKIDINMKEGKGNKLFVRLTKANISDKFDLSVLGDRISGWEIIQSVFGTVIETPLDPDNPDAASVTIPGQTPPEMLGDLYPGSMGMADLIQGPGKSNAKYMYCTLQRMTDDRNACGAVEPREWRTVATTSAFFRGTQEWAHAQLFGQPDVNSPVIVSGGILDSIATGGTMSTKAKQFFAIAPPGTYKMLLEVKYSTAATQNIGLMLRDHVSDLAAIEITQLMLNALQEAKSSNKLNVVGGSADAQKPAGATLSPSMLAREKVIQDELTAYRQAVNQTRNTIMNNIAQSAASLRALSQSFAVTSKR